MVQFVAVSATCIIPVTTFECIFATFPSKQFVAEFIRKRSMYQDTT